ncbi:hypothetical protein FGIG_02071 [Fasciola gigantica]|uniref:Uncharacterized protein n=1 Tax=Fasciola gigantica TaxID=46835 RepID=A0A504YXJ3_FASGI|nr:hypothetical protein FGIG_02071 [Fasciola gigantica]
MLRERVTNRQWTKDDDVMHCSNCQSEFSLINRKTEEISSGGNVTTTNRICGDQCRSYNNDLNGYGGRLGCCQKEKCNVNWPTASLSPMWRDILSQLFFLSRITCGQQGSRSCMHLMLHGINRKRLILTRFGYLPPSFLNVRN